MLPLPPPPLRSSGGNTSHNHHYHTTERHGHGKRERDAERERSSDLQRHPQWLGPPAAAPDCYFLPHQRRYSGEVVRVFVDYNNLPK